MYIYIYISFVSGETTFASKKHLDLYVTSLENPELVSYGGVMAKSDERPSAAPAAPPAPPAAPVSTAAATAAAAAAAPPPGASSSWRRPCTFGTRTRTPGTTSCQARATSKVGPSPGCQASESTSRP